MSIRCFPTFKILPWRVDAAEFWFSNINHLPWAMLLHSGNSDHPSSRFDILVADPLITLTTNGDITLISDRKSHRLSQSDPLVLLNETLQNLRLVTQPSQDLPFLGGALGLFGYDLGRRFENLPSVAKADIALPDMAVGLYDWALIVDHDREIVTLLTYGNLHDRLAWLKSQHPSPFTSDNFCLTSPWHSNMCKQEYIEKFRRIQKYLKIGDCYQVNLAQRFQATYQGNEWKAFCRLNTKNRAPFSAFIRLKQGAVLSLSPERFLRLVNGVIETRPIKGTLPRLIDDPLADQKQAKKLAISLKDRAENLMIVDLMRNDIGRVAVPGSVKVPELFVIESFATVHHLVSTITARLSTLYSACDLLRATFPGGSITGAPKIRAMEIIDELEPQRRNVWCGSIGYLSACGTMDTNIVIRTVTTWEGKIYCSAGGGIIADSEEQDEYQETFYKINSILKELES